MAIVKSNISRTTCDRKTFLTEVSNLKMPDIPIQGRDQACVWGQKVFLAMASPFLGELMKNTNNVLDTRLILPDFNHKTVEHVLELIHRGQTVVSDISDAQELESCLLTLGIIKPTSTGEITLHPIIKPPLGAEISESTEEQDPNSRDEAPSLCSLEIKKELQTVINSEAVSEETDQQDPLSLSNEEKNCHNDIATTEKPDLKPADRQAQGPSEDMPTLKPNPVTGEESPEIEIDPESSNHVYPLGIPVQKLIATSHDQRSIEKQPKESGKKAPESEFEALGGDKSHIKEDKRPQMKRKFQSGTAKWQESNEIKTVLAESPPSFSGINCEFSSESDEAVEVENSSRKKCKRTEDSMYKCRFTDCTFASDDMKNIKSHYSLEHFQRLFFKKKRSNGKPRIPLVPHPKKGVRCEMCMKNPEIKEGECRIKGGIKSVILHYAVFHDRLKLVLSKNSRKKIIVDILNDLYA